jgi:hypothetical protein
LKKYSKSFDADESQVFLSYQLNKTNENLISDNKFMMEEIGSLKKILKKILKNYISSDYHSSSNLEHKIDY